MAEVKWQKRAEKELYQLSAELERYPEIGFPEPLLKERNKLYRARHINKRFKLIYYYSEKTDTLHVVDIWDSKREPQSLAKRIK